MPEPDCTDRFTVHLDDPRPRIVDARGERVAAVEVLDLGDVCVQRALLQERPIRFAESPKPDPHAARGSVISTSARSSSSSFASREPPFSAWSSAAMRMSAASSSPALKLRTCA